MSFKDRRPGIGFWQRLRQHRESRRHAREFRRQQKEARLEINTSRLDAIKGLSGGHNPSGNAGLASQKGSPARPLAKKKVSVIKVWRCSINGEVTYDAIWRDGNGVVGASAGLKKKPTQGDILEVEW